MQYSLSLTNMAQLSSTQEHRSNHCTNSTEDYHIETVKLVYSDQCQKILHL